MTSASEHAELLISRSVSALDRTLGIILAALMFAMMVLTFLDVVGRQSLDSPISGSSELIEIAMGFVVYVGLPLVCMRREHITIGLLANMFRGRFLRTQHVVLNLVFAGVTLVWAREVWIQGESIMNSNAVLMFLQFSVAPCIFVMSALTFLSSLLFLMLAFCYFRGAQPTTVMQAE